VLRRGSSGVCADESGSRDRRPARLPRADAEYLMRHAPVWGAAAGPTGGSSAWDIRVASGCAPHGCPDPSRLCARWLWDYAQDEGVHHHGPYAGHGGGLLRWSDRDRDGSKRAEEGARTGRAGAPVPRTKTEETGSNNCEACAAAMSGRAVAEGRNAAGERRMHSRSQGARNKPGRETRLSCNTPLRSSVNECG
jgi:hypothetical protein